MSKFAPLQRAIDGMGTSNAPANRRASFVWAFTAWFTLLWTLAWVAHDLITGTWHDVLIAHNSDVDTCYWLAMKILVWAVVPYCYFRDRPQQSWQFIGLGRAQFIAGWRRGLAASLVWLALSAVFSAISGQHLTGNANGWLVAFYVVAVTPVLEELVFRGYVLSYLRDSMGSFWWANILTTVLFLVPHMIGYSFQGVLVRELRSTDFLTLAAFSLYAGYVRHKTGSTVASVMVHGTNNAWSTFTT